MNLASEKTEELDAALAKAQGEFPPIPKNRIADYPTKTGAKVSYRYADLADVIAATTPALSKNGLSVKQKIIFIEDKLWLFTKLSHSSGQWEGSLYPLYGSQRAQEFGSEITYARRYSLSPLIGVHSEDDQDGRLANDKQGVKESKTKGVQTQSAPQVVTQDQLKQLFEIADSAHWTNERVKEFMMQKYKIDSSKKLNRKQYEELCTFIIATPQEG